MTLFEVREEWEGWLANETAQCRKQNNLQKRCCSPLHLPCLQRAQQSELRACQSHCTGTLQLQSCFPKDFLCVQKNHLVSFRSQVSRL